MTVQEMLDKINYGLGNGHIALTDDILISTNKGDGWKTQSVGDLTMPAVIIKEPESILEFKPQIMFGRGEK